MIGCHPPASTQGVSDVFDFEDDKTRASLAQTFSINCGAPRCPSFTVVVSHLASKGVYCDDIGDPDTDDGQVCKVVADTVIGDG